MSLLRDNHYAICVDGGTLNRLRREMGRGFVGTLNKLDATRNPKKSDDSSKGFSRGSIMININNEKIFMCVGSKPGQAKWALIGQTEMYETDESMDDSDEDERGGVHRTIEKVDDDVEISSSDISNEENIKTDATEKDNKKTFYQEVIDNIDTDLLDSDIPHKETLVESGDVASIDDILNIYAAGETSRSKGLASISGIGAKKATDIEQWILNT